MRSPHPPAREAVGEQQWGARVISLDPHGARFQDFAQRNLHIPYQVFPAIRGAALDLAACVAAGLVTSDLADSGSPDPGALGCALSHRRLWQEAAGTAAGMLVLEDDVVTHPALADWISVHHQDLLQHDITYFGLNLDSILTIVTPQGLQQTCVFHPQYPDPAWIVEALAQTPAPQVRLVRLLRAFGTCCYFVSPRGAATLLSSAFPLSMATTVVPLVSEAMPGSSIDRRLNALFAQLQAWVTLPFLAYSPNDDSATQPGQQASAEPSALR